MTGFLVDTNLVSEQTKRRPHPVVSSWLLQGEDRYMSVLSFGELSRGARLLAPSDPVFAKRLRTWADGLRTKYSGRILPVDEMVMESWAAIPTTRTLPTIDGLLAATALAHDLTIATRNVADFEGTGARIFNPFAE